MRISDWSSDVCSSDLAVTAAISGALPAEARDSARSPGTDPPANLIVSGMWPGLRLQAARGIIEAVRSEEHTSELQSLMRISYAVFCLKKKNTNTTHSKTNTSLK